MSNDRIKAYSLIDISRDKQFIFEVLSEPYRYGYKQQLIQVLEVVHSQYGIKGENWSLVNKSVDQQQKGGINLYRIIASYGVWYFSKQTSASSLVHFLLTNQNYPQEGVEIFFLNCKKQVDKAYDLEKYLNVVQEFIIPLMKQFEDYELEIKEEETRVKQKSKNVEQPKLKTSQIVSQILLSNSPSKQKESPKKIFSDSEFIITPIDKIKFSIDLSEDLDKDIQQVKGGDIMIKIGSLINDLDYELDYIVWEEQRKLKCLVTIFSSFYFLEAQVLLKEGNEIKNFDKSKTLKNASDLNQQVVKVGPILTNWGITDSAWSQKKSLSKAGDYFQDPAYWFFQYSVKMFTLLPLFNPEFFFLGIFCWVNTLYPESFFSFSRLFGLFYFREIASWQSDPYQYSSLAIFKKPVNFQYIPDQQPEELFFQSSRITHNFIINTAPYLFNISLVLAFYIFSWLMARCFVSFGQKNQNQNQNQAEIEMGNLNVELISTPNQQQITQQNEINLVNIENLNSEAQKQGEEEEVGELIQVSYKPFNLSFILLTKTLENLRYPINFYLILQFKKVNFLSFLNGFSFIVCIFILAAQIYYYFHHLSKINQFKQKLRQSRWLIVKKYWMFIGNLKFDLQVYKVDYTLPADQQQFQYSKIIQNAAAFKFLKSWFICIALISLQNYDNVQITLLAIIFFVQFIALAIIRPYANPILMTIQLIQSLLEVIIVILVIVIKTKTKDFQAKNLIPFEEVTSFEDFGFVALGFGYAHLSFGILITLFNFYDSARFIIFKNPEDFIKGYQDNFFPAQATENQPNQPAEELSSQNPLKNSQNQNQQQKQNQQQQQNQNNNTNNSHSLQNFQGQPQQDSFGLASFGNQSQLLRNEEKNDAESINKKNGLNKISKKVREQDKSQNKIGALEISQIDFVDQSVGDFTINRNIFSQESLLQNIQNSSSKFLLQQNNLKKVESQYQDQSQLNKTFLKPLEKRRFLDPVKTENFNWTKLIAEINSLGLDKYGENWVLLSARIAEIIQLYPTEVQRNLIDKKVDEFTLQLDFYEKIKVLKEQSDLVDEQNFIFGLLYKGFVQISNLLEPTLFIYSLQICQQFIKDSLQTRFLEHPLNSGKIRFDFADEGIQARDILIQGNYYFWEKKMAEKELYTFSVTLDFIKVVQLDTNFQYKLQVSILPEKSKQNLPTENPLPNGDQYSSYYKIEQNKISDTEIENQKFIRKFYFEQAAERAEFERSHPKIQIHEFEYQECFIAFKISFENFVKYLDFQNNYTISIDPQYIKREIYFLVPQFL